MAMRKFGHANLVQAGISPDQWTDKVYKEACKDGQCRMKTAKFIIAKFSPDKYLLSHCTIIASVDVDLADPKDPKSDYLIKPEFSQFINNNGDAWTKGVILNTYKTFIGGHNFLEHVQIEELSKGRIIDAVLREIAIGKDKNGKELTTYYVDILVATDRKHEDLVRKIESKEITTLSMGTLIKFSICSKCGNRAKDETEACEHIRYQKNNMFFDENGIQRKIAELCGHESESDSNRFIEASWVKQPAFTGAVLRSFVEPTEELLSKIESANKVLPYKKKENDYLKAAADLGLIAQESEKTEPKKEDVPPPPEEEMPPEEPAPEEESTEISLETTPVEEVPAEEGEFKKMKRDLKKKIFKQVQDEVLEELSEDEESGAPRDIETLDETLIKPASLTLSKMWGAQKSWDRFINQKLQVKLDKKSYDRLRYGIHIAMTNNDLTSLRDYGYSKREVLAVLSFIDGCFKDRLPISIKKAVVSIGGTNRSNPMELLATVVSKIGRKLTRIEARKVLAWLRLLDFYS